MPFATLSERFASLPKRSQRPIIGDIKQNTQQAAATKAAARRSLQNATQRTQRRQQQVAQSRQEGNSSRAPKAVANQFNDRFARPTMRPTSPIKRGQLANRSKNQNNSGPGPRQFNIGRRAMQQSVYVGGRASHSILKRGQTGKGKGKGISFRDEVEFIQTPKKAFQFRGRGKGNAAIGGKHHVVRRAGTAPSPRQPLHSVVRTKAFKVNKMSGMQRGRATGRGGRGQGQGRTFNTRRAETW